MDALGVCVDGVRVGVAGGESCLDDGVLRFLEDGVDLPGLGVRVVEVDVVVVVEVRFGGVVGGSSGNSCLRVVRRVGSGFAAGVLGVVSLVVLGVDAVLLLVRRVLVSSVSSLPERRPGMV